MASRSPASPVRAGAGMRLLRAAVFTAVCVALSAAGHGLASRHGVPAGALVAGGLAVFAVAAPLAGRERSLPGIATALALGQLALHAVFGAGQVCAEPAAARDGADGVMALAGRLLCDGHARGLTLTPQGAERIVRDAGLDPASTMTMSPVTQPGDGGMHSALAYSLPMLLAHLFAALAAGWLLRRGEAALWQLVSLSADVLRGALVALVRVLVAGSVDDPLAALRPRRFACGHGLAGSVRLRHSLARRGPPAYALAV
ncbi:hypothetical protein QMK19_01645 [Streptomyces sp. H10-C2]|uniref:hypothetical protein n=1 Tax=unclassified Streptomyces TaxID=2593676 RepID=UPI0024B8F978|nr:MULTISPECIES: hypothetical protein [unclassified Streptomyces]MDJ0342079.1 hypothetical protein [Streptomyces sp. PH10-H1]MDJ0368421.1 hypothetical protein [Streptomyces sp. H10-C2]